MDKEQNNSTARKNRDKKRAARIAAPFLCCLFLLAVVAFIIPLRPTVSMTEKRELKKFPEFTAESLVSGDYFDGISTWFSDTFPGRETWLSVNTRINELHGLNKNAVSYSSAMVAEEIPDAPTDLSQLEELPELPEPSMAVQVNKDGTLGADVNEEALFGNCIQLDGAAYEFYGFNKNLLDYRAKFINEFIDKLDDPSVRVIDFPVPSGVGVMMSDELLEKIGCSDQNKAIEYMFSIERPEVLKINAIPSMKEHNYEYLYYRTDHHWTAVGAYYGYKAFCEAAGFEPSSLEDDFVFKDMGKFLGTFYASSTKPLSLIPDDMETYYPKENITHRARDGQMNEIDEELILDVTDYNESAKYSCFLAGDQPMSILTNNDLPDGPNCIIVKDSYGNPFSIFLAHNYHKVYAIDYRKMSSALSWYIKEYDIDDVIIAESMSMTQGEDALFLIRDMLN